jgi:hypothetical protein
VAVRKDSRKTYWASGCGHADALEFSEFDEFPNCKTCSQPINWICRKPAEI